MTAFSIEQFLRIQCFGVKQAVLSLADYSAAREKNVLHGQHTREGRKTIEEHLKSLRSAQAERLPPAETPFLVVSVRNVLANLRCGAIVRKTTSGFVTTDEEPADARAYHLLGWQHGRFEILEHDADDEALREVDWALSGVPVLWDDEDPLPRIVTEAADHSHVFHLPRGSHPKATTETRARWARLHEVFKSTLPIRREEAFRMIWQAAAGLERETAYLHNILGVDRDGHLIVQMSVGKLESLGQQIGGAGARRALMVDNGGSCVVAYFPDGTGSPGITLFAAPNHRSSGTAYLFLYLETPTFSFHSSSE